MTSDSELERRADLLIKDHWQLIDRLVAIRKEHGLSIEKVAFRMGVLPEYAAVLDRQGPEVDWRLSEIRRYALAVGATTHTIITKEANA
ncbi:XRE family transcriptional regulator [Acidipropionibacterium acidipropionici]|uniref:Uncharacterized protein n=1 Tax=Acidipropionibacterium acidipropionici TaxID=1748 RepID=A0AAC9FCE9_9ACTN|nr:hypothetical protein [Acidipropionibacterium acidipropionici]AMS06463.1 hypothetical protein AXH35_14395 [Acidipropionibacterium acidipropionici]AOZ47910.1 hypothetical protein A8L58_15850 [Acidipropionibacterium acidipropionici]AZP38744.1 XRE family transcriptional regulator [Acidipropionibacterium acidipropionici]